MPDREIQIYNQKASVASSAMNVNQFLAMLEKRQAEAADAATAEENKDAQMADESAGAATTMINTSGSGVKIGTNDPSIVLEDITDEDEKRGVLLFLKEQAKKEKFRDRLSLQLEAVKKQAHHTRAKIRVRMPDGYIL